MRGNHFCNPSTRSQCTSALFPEPSKPILSPAETRASERVTAGWCEVCARGTSPCQIVPRVFMQSPPVRSTCTHVSSVFRTARNHHFVRSVHELWLPGPAKKVPARAWFNVQYKRESAAEMRPQQPDCWARPESLYNTSAWFMMRPSCPARGSSHWTRKRRQRQAP